MEWVEWAREIASRTPRAFDHPALANAELVLELEEREREGSAASDRASRKLHRNLCLAPTLEVFEALVRGDAVPLDRLDPEAVRRFGRRRSS